MIVLPIDNYRIPGQPRQAMYASTSAAYFRSGRGSACIPESSSYQLSGTRRDYRSWSRDSQEQETTGLGGGGGIFTSITRQAMRRGSQETSNLY